MEKNEFQNGVFLFSNFLGAAILNNCDVSFLLYHSNTKSYCVIRKGQPFHVTIVQDGGARELSKQKQNDSIIHVFKVNALC